MILIIAFGGFFALSPAVQKAYPEDDSRLASSISFNTGFLYGQSQEIVYANSVSSQFQSELLWDHTPLFYLGAAASLSRDSLLSALGLFANLSFNAGLPLRSGEMEDRDWLGTNYALSHYSLHEAYSRMALFGNFDLGASIPLRYRDRKIASLKIYGSFSYLYFAWDSCNGYTQYLRDNPDYDVWDPSMPQIPYSGRAISYSQQWFLISPGIGMDFPIGSHWLLGFSFAISPLIWADAVDHHLSPGNQMQFEDKPSGGIYMEPRLEISFSPNKRVAFSGAVSYRHIAEARGASRRRSMLNGEPAGDFTAWVGNSAGAGYKALDTRLGVKVFF
jgi:outer membrane protease